MTIKSKLHKLKSAAGTAAKTAGKIAGLGSPETTRIKEMAHTRLSELKDKYAASIPYPTELHDKDRIKNAYENLRSLDTLKLIHPRTTGDASNKQATLQAGNGHALSTVLNSGACNDIRTQIEDALTWAGDRRKRLEDCHANLRHLNTMLAAKKDYYGIGSRVTLVNANAEGIINEHAEAAEEKLNILFNQGDFQEQLRGILHYTTNAQIEELKTRLIENLQEETKAAINNLNTKTDADTKALQKNKDANRKALLIALYKSNKYNRAAMEPLLLKSPVREEYILDDEADLDNPHYARFKNIKISELQAIQITSNKLFNMHAQQTGPGQWSIAISRLNHADIFSKNDVLIEAFYVVAKLNKEDYAKITMSVNHPDKDWCKRVAAAQFKACVLAGYDPDGIEDPTDKTKRTPCITLNVNGETKKPEDILSPSELQALRDKYASISKRESTPTMKQVASEAKINNKNLDNADSLVDEAHKFSP